LNLQIIILKQLKPTPLSQIELLLGEDILQTLMVSVDLA